MPINNNVISFVADTATTGGASTRQTTSYTAIVNTQNSSTSSSSSSGSDSGSAPAPTSTDYVQSNTVKISFSSPIQINVGDKIILHMRAKSTTNYAVSTTVHVMRLTPISQGNENTTFPSSLALSGGQQWSSFNVTVTATSAVTVSSMSFSMVTAKHSPLIQVEISSIERVPASNG